MPRILIVDDEPYITRALSFVFEKEEYGFEVEVASDGEEALRCIEKRKPDILFLDIMLPKLDGYEVTRKLKENPKTKDIYIILLTARGGNEDQKKGLRLGADAYITKPFSPSALVKKAQEVLRKKGKGKDGS
jgi:DNA-binding response OmpR family regulator